MKRMLMVMVVLLAMVAFASGAIAQAPAKPAPAPGAPAPAPEKPKMEKPKVMSFGGVVAAYEAGKMIKVKGAKEKEMTFDVTADTKMKGEVKEGAKVTVMYKKEMGKMVATSISVAPPPKKKEAAPKKEMKEEKKM